MSTSGVTFHVYCEIHHLVLKSLDCRMWGEYPDVSQAHGIPAPPMVSHILGQFSSQKWVLSLHLTQQVDSSLAEQEFPTYRNNPRGVQNTGDSAPQTFWCSAAPLRASRGKLRFKGCENSRPSSVEPFRVQAIEPFGVSKWKQSEIFKGTG